jgi:Zn-dependent protease
VHVSFFILLAYVAWEGWTEASSLGALWIVAFMLALFTCVTLHELGHAFAARHFGVHVPRILLLPIGGMAEMESIPRSPRAEIIIALAGPAVNYLIIGVLMIFVRFPAGLDLKYFELTIAGFGRSLVVVNLIMGVLNLLPAFPMDGGRVFRALLAMRLPYLRATKIAVVAGKVVALTAAVYCALELNYMGVVLFMFIIFAGEMELRAMIRREQAAEHWRMIQSRFQSPPDLPPSEGTPPRLI